MAASPFDVNSSCLYNSAEDNHRISFRIETKNQNTKFWKALIKHPNVEIEKVQRPSLEEPEREICYAKFKEKDLLNNPINSNVLDAIEDVRKIGNFKTYRDLNYDNSPWNEIIICAKLNSVSGLFFSGDHSQIEDKIYSNEVFRDFQLINTMLLAGMLSKGIDYEGKFKIQKNYPIYEYDSKSLSLTKINLEYEKKLILEKYDDLPAETKKHINHASDLDLGFSRF